VHARIADRAQDRVLDLIERDGPTAGIAGIAKAGTNVIIGRLGMMLTARETEATR